MCPIDGIVLELNGLDVVDDAMLDLGFGGVESETFVLMNVLFRLSATLEAPDCGIDVLVRPKPEAMRSPTPRVDEVLVDAAPSQCSQFGHGRLGRPYHLPSTQRLARVPHLLSRAPCHSRCEYSNTKEVKMKTEKGLHQKTLVICAIKKHACLHTTVRMLHMQHRDRPKRCYI